MKYLSTKFEDYINECQRYNLHPNIEKILKKDNNQNIILYGAPGIGKYTQALHYIKNYSPTQLKYERKLNYNFNNKKNYVFKISDIHIEIDMSLLGCNSKVLFNDLYHQILDIFSTRENKFGIILCKNFHKIHSELLEIFYSYMQNITHKNIKIMYIIISEHISFIPSNILIRCNTLSLNRPNKSKYSLCVQKQLKKDIILNEINNIKNLKFNIMKLNHKNRKFCNVIINNIDNYNDIQFLQFRDIIYDILIFNLDINECIFYIIKHYINENKLTKDNIDKIFNKLIVFFRQYNNNYRPIYHLENFFYYLCSIIHGLQ